MNAIQRATIDLIARRQPADMDAWALARVRAMGKVVLPVQGAPELGTTWVPTRGNAVARTIEDIDGEWLHYLDYPPSWLGHWRVSPCTLATWHRWVRRTQAVRA